MTRFPLCNQRADRAPRIGNIIFPLCFRCTGVLVGVFIPTYFTGLILGVILILPMIFDGVRQYFFHKESTNSRRLLTGILFGYGMKIALQGIETIV